LNFENIILSGEADQVFFNGTGDIEITGGGGNDARERFILSHI